MSDLEIISDEVRLLVTAVNNKIRECNYLKLHSELLSGSISEEEFDRIIDENEDDYVITEDQIPSEELLSRAIEISKLIKGINSMEDFTGLFSFDYSKIESLIKRKED